MLEDISPKVLLLGVVGLYVAYVVTKQVVDELKIRRLGGRARSLRSGIPFDLDFVYHGIKATMAHKNLDSFLEYFSPSLSRQPGLRYNCEVSPAGQRIIFTADPTNIKAILAAQFADFGKGAPFHADWKDFLGDSIFTTDGDSWHSSRQLIRPMFLKERVADLEGFERHVQVLMRKIGEESAKGVDGGMIDISNLFFRYTLDAATDFLLGRSVDSLEVPEIKFAEAFAEVQRMQNLIARVGPLNGLVPRKSFNAGIEEIDRFVNPFIDDALQLSPSDLETRAKTESSYTFLHALASFTRDRKVLRDQLVAVLLAGRDTTAATLSWLFFELGKHPEVFSKLRAEILREVGHEQLPTYADLKGLKYLQWCLQEISRLYPAVPYNVRIALHDTMLPVGGGPDGLSPIGVLKDTPIAYSTLVLHRRDDLTEDAQVFKPERWEKWTPKPWQYIPFNGGPRICIGQQFALTEMGYTVVRMLQRYDKVQGDGRDAVLKSEIVLTPGEGVRVSLRQAEK